MAISLLVLVVALYSAVATAYLEARRRRERPPMWARAVGLLAVIAHLAGLIALSSAIGRSPFSTISQSLSFLAFSLVALYVILEATSRVATHGGGFFALAALLAALSVPGLIQTGEAAGIVEKHTARTFHVGLSLMGTAAVLAGGLLAGGYLGAYRRVKEASLDAGAEGPSLRGFERLERRASLLGVMLLGPALALGMFSAKSGDSPPGLAVLVALTVLMFVFVLFAGWLWWFRPLRGRLAAWLNLLAMVAAIVATILVHPLVTGGGS